MSESKTPEILRGATRQYRHNNDNSPSLTQPEGGFVCAFNAEETVRIVSIRNQGKEVIRVDHIGRAFWNGREVETDEDFRGAMLELRDFFMGRK